MALPLAPAQITHNMIIAEFGVHTTGTEWKISADGASYINFTVGSIIKESDFYGRSGETGYRILYANGNTAYSSDPTSVNYSTASPATWSGGSIGSNGGHVSGGDTDGPKYLAQSNGITVISGQGNQFFTSSNGGNNWTRGTWPVTFNTSLVSTDHPNANVLADSSGNFLAIETRATGGVSRVLYSSDGLNWVSRTSINHGNTGAQYAAADKTTGRLFIASLGGGTLDIWYTDNLGASWNAGAQNVTAGAGGGHNIYADNNVFMIVGGAPFVGGGLTWRSTNGGVSGTGGNNINASGGTGTMYIMANDGNTWFARSAIASGLNFRTSTDAGANWIDSTPTSSTDYQLKSMTTSAGVSNSGQAHHVVAPRAGMPWMVLVGYSHALFTSSNGITWTERRAPANGGTNTNLNAYTGSSYVYNGAMFIEL